MIATEQVRVSCPLCHGRNSNSERFVNGYALERCRRCGFVFVNPRPSEDALNSLYTDRQAETLIRLYSTIASPSTPGTPPDSPARWVAVHRRPKLPHSADHPGQGRLCAKHTTTTHQLLYTPHIAGSAQVRRVSGHPDYVCGRTQMGELARQSL
jgi:hypothetical protein